MYLSKSKYCLGVQCKKILWLDKYSPEESENVTNDEVFDVGNKVGELAKELFGFHIDINFSEDLKQMLADTENLLKLENIVITEASFVYENNFCSVDILKKEGDSYEIYEVKSSTYVKDTHLDDIAYQTFILRNLGYNVTKCSIVHIDNTYVRNGDLQLNKLFKIVDVTDIVLSKQDEIKNNIIEISNYMNSNIEREEKLGIHCLKPYKCRYFKYCTGHLGANNIFKLSDIRNDKKFKLYNDGIITYEDLLNEDISDKARQQIEFELYDKEDYIDKEQIKTFLNTLSYPLYFLDFETFQQAIPEYNGISPYMKIPFQYSLHYILEAGGEVLHKEFLAEAGIDPRRSLAEKLVEDIPKDVCVLAYNMSFEKGVIRNLAALYPDLSEHLLNIHNDIKDLMIVFSKRYYYTKEMYGSYSIKYVLPALFPDDPSLNYHSLELVHNGEEASNLYANMEYLPKEEQEKLRESLLKYCGLDTYAMVKIWEKLIEQVKE